MATNASKKKTTTGKTGGGLKGAAEEVIKEGVKKAGESVGLSKKKGAFWGWLIGWLASFFSFTGGREMAKETGEKALTENFRKVFFKSFSRDDDNLYALANKWFSVRDRRILGTFEQNVDNSEFDLVGFFSQLGELNKAYAEDNKDDSKNPDKKQENPAYVALKRIVDAGEEGLYLGKSAEEIFTDQIQVCGLSMMQKKIGSKLGVRNCYKNPLVIIPLLVFGFFILLLVGGVFFVVLFCL